MLDRDQTRARFQEWVKSRDFKRRLKVRFKAPRWPWIAAGLAFAAAFAGLENQLLGNVCLLGMIFFPLWGWNLWNTARLRRKAFRVSLGRHEPIPCAMVIANKNLMEKRVAVAPALLLGSPDPEDPFVTESGLTAAELLSGLYGESADSVPPGLREACRMVNDDAYQADRRRRLPTDLFDHDNLWLFDAMMFADDMPAPTDGVSLIPFMVAPEQAGSIIQIPQTVAVFAERIHDPNIIRHEAPASPPPLVAPVSDNCEAVTAHIQRFLGEPATVFHELISTTVHIDVHIVPPTRERPWVSLITSGMSDLPMVGSSRVDLQACKLEYSIVSPK